MERAGTSSVGGWQGGGPVEPWLDLATGHGCPESHGGGWRLGSGFRDPEDDHWSRRHPLPLTARSGAGAVGRPRKGCRTTPWIKCFWTLAVWAVVLATGIYTGSQPSASATTRSHLVPRLPVPCLLTPCFLMSFLLVLRHRDPSPRTLLPLLAQRRAPGRMTTWRYVGSTCQ